MPDFYPELGLLSSTFGRSLCVAAIVWCLYIALEPAVRRLWPNGLVGWSRLVAGRVRDPLVGHDILIGTLSGLALTTLWSQFHILLPEWLGRESPAFPFPFPGPQFYNPLARTLLGGRFVVAGLLSVVLAAVYATLVMWVLLLTLRIVLRKDALVAIALVIFWTVLSWSASFSNYTWTGLVCALAGSVLFFTTYMRFGLLATIHDLT